MELRIATELFCSELAGDRVEHLVAAREAFHGADVGVPNFPGEVCFREPGLKAKRIAHLAA
jgi:hypothetical protein